MRPLVFLCLSLGATTLAEAATVKKLKAEKKIVILDEGSRTGFMKAKKVCFYDENKVKIACGKVRSAKAKISSVGVKKQEDFDKIKVGMEATIETIDNKNVKITIGEEAPAPAEEGYLAPHYIGLFGGFPIRDPVSYQNLIYTTPQGLPAESMWKAESPVKSVSMGGEVGFGFSSYTLALGFRSSTYSPKRIAADYADKENNGYFEEYVESIGKGKSTGLWVDFSLDHKVDGSDAITTLYKVKSSLNAISLRTNLFLDFKFGPVGFKMGSVLFVPLSQKQKLTVEQSDPFTTQFLKDKTAEDDLKDKLAHKSQVGLDLLLMGYVAY